MKKLITVSVILICIFLNIPDIFLSIPDFIFTNTERFKVIGEGVVWSITFMYVSISILLSILFVLFVLKEQIKIAFLMYIIITVLSFYTWWQIYIVLNKDNNYIAYNIYVLWLWMLYIAINTVFVIAITSICDLILSEEKLMFPWKKIEKTFLKISALLFISWLWSLLFSVFYQYFIW